MQDGNDAMDSFQNYFSSLAKRNQESGVWSRFYQLQSPTPGTYLLLFARFSEKEIAIY